MIRNPYMFRYQIKGSFKWWIEIKFNVVFWVLSWPKFYGSKIPGHTLVSKIFIFQLENSKILTYPWIFGHKSLIGVKSWPPRIYEYFEKAHFKWTDILDNHLAKKCVFWFKWLIPGQGLRLFFGKIAHPYG